MDSPLGAWEKGKKHVKDSSLLSTFAHFRKPS